MHFSIFLRGSFVFSAIALAVAQGGPIIGPTYGTNTSKAYPTATVLEKRFATSSSHGSKRAAQSSSTKASSASSSTGDSLITGGFATFFFQNGVPGACGVVHQDSDLIAAIDSQRYGDTSVVSALCGKQANIINIDNGKSVVVTIADACSTCQNSNSMDLSVGAFDQIAEESAGEVPISWEFV